MIGNAILFVTYLILGVFLLGLVIIVFALDALFTRFPFLHTILKVEEKGGDRTLLLSSLNLVAMSLHLRYATR
jgi:hypothetical protein